MKTSIVLLAYNQESYVAEAVASVLRQIGGPYEIILSDDCSDDSTFDVIQKTVAAISSDHSVILNRNSINMGLAKHLNKTFAMTKGEIIIAAAGDDISLPDRSLRLIEKFESTGAWLVHSQARCIDPDGNPAQPDYRNALFFKTTDPVKAAASQALYLGATAAFHRDIIRKYGPLDNPLLFEDLIYGFRAALEQKVGFVDEELVIYRTGSGISAKPIQETVAEKTARQDRQMVRFLAILEQRRRDASTFGLSDFHPVMKKIVAVEIKTHIGLALLRRDKLEFRKWARKAPIMALRLWRTDRKTRSVGLR